MKDKEYHMANFATFVCKTLTFSLQKMDEFNFRPAQYCINKIFECIKSCIWVISRWMWQSGWTLYHAILVWNLTCDCKSNLRCAPVWFWNHAYDFSPNCTPISSITIINFKLLKNVINAQNKNIAFLTKRWGDHSSTISLNMLLKVVKKVHFKITQIR